MKTNCKDQQNPMFKWAFRGLKYFLLMLLGFLITYVMSQAFGIVAIAEMLLSEGIWVWFFRIAVFLFCWFVIAMIVESWG